MARYQDAIEWMVLNDDTEIMHEDAEDPTLTVTASLVADLFQKSDEQVMADVRKRLRKENKY